MSRIPAIVLGFVAVASLAGNVLLYQRYSSNRPLMRIGSDAITIGQYRDLLDNQYGKVVLTKMALAKIVDQEAKAAGVTPTEQDIDKRIAEIERRSPNALQAAHANSEQMKTLRRDLATDLALENLSLKDVKVTDKEVAAFYQKNQQLFRLPRQVRTTIAVANNQIDAATAAALLRDPKMTPSVIANQPRLAVVGVNGFQPNWSVLPVAAQNKLSADVLRTPQGDVVTTAVAADTFLVTRVDKITQNEVQSLASAKPLAERLTKLSKAPPQALTLARLYKKVNPRFEISKYAGFFRDIETLAKQGNKGEQTASLGQKPAS